MPEKIDPYQVLSQMIGAVDKRVDTVDEARREELHAMLADLESRIAAGVVAGMRQALTDDKLVSEAVEKVVDKATDIVMERSRRKAGDALLGLGWHACKRAGMFALLGLVAYYVGGWAALAKIIAWFGDLFRDTPGHAGR